MTFVEPQPGQLFEDTSYRGRIVKVIGPFQKRDPWNNLYDAYRVVTVESPSWPSGIGNVSSIKASAFGKRMKAVVR